MVTFIGTVWKSEVTLLSVVCNDISPGIIYLSG